MPRIAATAVAAHWTRYANPRLASAIARSAYRDAPVRRPSRSAWRRSRPSASIRHGYRRNCSFADPAAARNSAYPARPKGWERAPARDKALASVLVATRWLEGLLAQAGERGPGW